MPEVLPKLICNILCFPVQDIGTSAEEMIDRMQAGLADDLNPQPAVSSLWEAAKKVNELCYTKKAGYL